MRYKMTIAYDGTDYSGWQVQANGPSIQALVQKALQTVLRHDTDLTGSGRTDAGVHARGQVAHFDTEHVCGCHSINTPPPSDTPVLDIRRSINTPPPSDTPVLDIRRSINTPPPSDTPGLDIHRSINAPLPSDTPVLDIHRSIHTPPPSDTPVLDIRRSINALLPPDIRILDIAETAPDFHARYSAKGKIYHYHVHTSPVLDPFTRLYRYQVFGPCDIDRLKKSAPLFLGRHDFTSFANEKGVPQIDAVRTLKRLDLIEQKGGFRLEFEGGGFLYKMVRNITGTLLDIAAGKIDPTSIPALLAARNRRLAGQTAPPQGLFLTKVLYD